MGNALKVWLIGIIVIIMGAGFYFTPHLAIHNMKRAIEVKDFDTFSGYIDYPALRENLKASINTLLIDKATKTGDRNPLGFLGTAFASVMVGPMVDIFITPENLAVLMKGEKPDLGNHRRGSLKRPEKSRKDMGPDISMSYKSFNRFTMRIREKETDDDGVEFIFRRDGIVSWKLSRIMFLIPPDSPQNEHVAESVQESDQNHKIGPGQDKKVSIDASQPYLFDLLEKPSYQKSWNELFKREKNIDGWLVLYAKTENGLAMPRRLIKSGGITYEASSVCKKHDCRDNIFFVLFAPNGSKAWGLLLKNTTYERFFGNPNKNQKQFLRSLARE
ncbi:MAG: DUF2939 domain-containing protein [Syntrophobacterales bacterium]|jgi:hypothetical protein|nr:DUF2939 domain-containing protein [Syntrophobacterales bacterium]